MNLILLKDSTPKKNRFRFGVGLKTSHAGIVFSEQNETKFVDISQIVKAISRITEPILGVFVLN